MKKKVYFVLFVYLLFVTPLFAQKVRYEKKDKKIYVDEKPYGIIELINRSALTGNDYSLQTLAGKEIVVFKFDSDKNFYQVIFMETGEKAYLTEYLLSFKDIAKLVVANKFIENEVLSEEGKKRFLLLNGTEPAPRPNKIGKFAVNLGLGSNNDNNNSTPSVPATQQYRLVERDKSATFFVMNGKIEQDFKLIGKYQEKDRMDYGKIYQIFEITLPDGTLVAEATGEGAAPTVYEVFTYADRRKSQIKVNFSSDPLADIARYLTNERYL